MFSITNVPVVLRKITLALEDDDDNGRQRICKTTFRIPLLTFERASQVQDVKVLWCCFTRDGLPRWELDDVKFAPPEGHFTVTVRSAPDSDPTAVLPLATIDTIRVWRPKDDQRDLMMEFVTRHELARGDAKDLADLLTAWEGGTSYLTFTSVQLSLEMEPDDTGRDDDTETDGWVSRKAH